MTRAELEELIDTDIVAAVTALDQENLGTYQGAYHGLKMKFLDPPVGFSFTDLRNQLKLLLSAVFSSNQTQTAEPTQPYQHTPTTATNKIDGQGNNSQYFQGLTGSNVNIVNNHNYLYGIPAATASLGNDELYEWFKKELNNTIYADLSPHESRLVDCNRFADLKQMKKHWKKSTGHKFFFIVSCSSQRPDSMVQHFIYALNQAESDQKRTDSETVFMQYTRDTTWDQTTMINISKIQALMELDWFMRDFVEQINKFEPSQLNTSHGLNRNVYESKEAFQAYIQDRLAQHKTYHNSAFAYEFDALEWQYAEDFCALLKDWLDIFSTLPTQGPNCQFFFILKIPHIHHRKELDHHELNLLNSIQNIAQSFPDHTLVIDKLDQVGLGEVQAWVNRMIKASLAREMLFANWYTKYKAPLQPDDKLDMEIVSIFMQMLWNYAHKQLNIAQS